MILAPGRASKRDPHDANMRCSLLSIKPPLGSRFCPFWTTYNINIINKRKVLYAFWNTRKSTNMNRNKTPQNAKIQERKNTSKTKQKSTNAPFLAPHGHQNQQNSQGFICIFRNHVLAQIGPFPATQHLARDQFL